MPQGRFNRPEINGIGETTLEDSESLWFNFDTVIRDSYRVAAARSSAFFVLVRSQTEGLVDNNKVDFNRCFDPSPETD